MKSLAFVCLIIFGKTFGQEHFPLEPQVVYPDQEWRTENIVSSGEWVTIDQGQFQKNHEV